MYLQFLGIKYTFSAHNKRFDRFIFYNFYALLTVLGRRKHFERLILNISYKKKRCAPNIYWPNHDLKMYFFVIKLHEFDVMFSRWAEHDILRVVLYPIISIWSIHLMPNFGLAKLSFLLQQSCKNYTKHDGLTMCFSAVLCIAISSASCTIWFAYLINKEL